MAAKRQKDSSATTGTKTTLPLARLIPADATLSGRVVCATLHAEGRPTSYSVQVSRTRVKMMQTTDRFEYSPDAPTRVRREGGDMPAFNEAFVLGDKLVIEHHIRPVATLTPTGQHAADIAGMFDEIAEHTRTGTAPQALLDRIAATGFDVVLNAFTRSVSGTVLRDGAKLADLHRILAAAAQAHGTVDGPKIHIDFRCADDPAQCEIDVTLSPNTRYGMATENAHRPQLAELLRAIVKDYQPAGRYVYVSQGGSVCANTTTEAFPLHAAKSAHEMAAAIRTLNAWVASLPEDRRARIHAALDALAPT